MDNLPKCKIPLDDIVKSISSNLNNGTRRVLILPSNDGQAEKVLACVRKQKNWFFRVQTYFGRKIKICSEAEFFSYNHNLREDFSKSTNQKAERYNTPANPAPVIPRIYKINLREIELT